MNTITMTVTGDTYQDVAAKMVEIGSKLGAAQTTPPINEAPVKRTRAPKVVDEAPAEVGAVEVDEAPAEVESDDNFETPAEEPAPAKKAKTTKVKEFTLDDIRAGFKAYAAEHSREKALALLPKFKVKSILDLKPAQYNEVMAILNK